MDTISTYFVYGARLSTLNPECKEHQRPLHLLLSATAIARSAHLSDAHRVQQHGRSCDCDRCQLQRLSAPRHVSSPTARLSIRLLRAERRVRVGEDFWMPSYASPADSKMMPRHHVSGFANGYPRGNTFDISPHR